MSEKMPTPLLVMTPKVAVNVYHVCAVEVTKSHFTVLLDGGTHVTGRNADLTPEGRYFLVGTEANR